jgi:hypothetical protein
MDLATLRDSEPADLLTAAEAYDRLAAAFGRHTAAWRSGVAERVGHSGWTGTAAENAKRSLQATTGRITAAGTELDLIGGVLREGAEAFLLARSKLLDALDEARANGLTVGGDGSVSWPPPSPADRHDPDYDTPRKGREIADRISAALAEADHADRTTAERLAHYTANARSGAGLDGATATTDLAASISPFGHENLLARGMPDDKASPTEVNSWWNGLTEDEQQRLVRDHPDLVGNRDGIPAAARDQANRILLPRLIDQYERMPRRSEDDQTKLDGFRKIQARLRQEDGLRKEPHAYLLGIGTEGQGRAVVSFGNPDTADDVVAYVPGLGTKVGDVGGKDGNRAKALWESAHNADPSRKVASIAWLGYDAPQLKGVDTESLMVAGKGRGQQGGEAYDRFLTGIRASHEGTQPHVTALGHSYGSFTVGQAAQRPGGVPADDVVLVGSPGTGAQHASQLGVGADHVWVGAARNDPVTHLPSRAEAAGIPLGLPGVAIGHAIDPHELWFGQDPSSEEFGAHRFDVADGSVKSSHSDYWNSGSGREGASLRNLGRIVTGHGDRIETQEPR